MIEYIKKLPKISISSLLVFVLILFKFLSIGGVSVFIVSALAILVIVVIIGKATEEISLYYNPVIAGVINTTFGNIN
jgi:hypothetical protein